MAKLVLDLLDEGTPLLLNLDFLVQADADALYLAIANDLSDLNNAGTARTNLGLVAGGVGDVWVEKAGDIMSGDLTLANSATALQSGNYPVQMEAGVADGATAIGYIFDTTNDLATAGSEMAIWRNQGTDVVHIEKDGLFTHSKMAIGSNAVLGGSAGFTLFDIKDDVNITSVGDAPALSFEINVIGSQIVATPIGLSANVIYSGTGIIPTPRAFKGIIKQNSNQAWFGSGLGPAVYTGEVHSSAGTAAMSDVSIFRALSITGSELAGGKPSSLSAFKADSMGLSGITDAYGLFTEKQVNASNNYGIFLNGDGAGADIVFGSAKDASILYDNTNLIIQPDLVGTGYVHIYTDQALALVIGAGTVGVDYQIKVDGETNDGTYTWMEDEDSWRFNDDVSLDNGEFLIFDKASGNGMKVDTTTPTFGFADLLGDQFSKNTGATKPTLAAYNGNIDVWQFSDGNEAFLSYHIPHDYVKGTDIYLHIHWSQTSTTATGGTVDFKYSAIYAKAHNQATGATFTGTPITATFSSININDGGAGLSQYQQHLTEVVISGASLTATLFDRDDFEPDGVVELTLEMVTNNLTNSVTVLDPFIHFIDIHYQTTGLIGTKSRAPDFYA